MVVGVGELRSLFERDRLSFISDIGVDMKPGAVIDQAFLSLDAERLHNTTGAGLGTSVAERGGGLELMVLCNGRTANDLRPRLVSTPLPIPISSFLGFELWPCSTKTHDSKLRFDRGRSVPVLGLWL